MTPRSGWGDPLPVLDDGSWPDLALRAAPTPEPDPTPEPTPTPASAEGAAVDDDADIYYRGWLRPVRELLAEGIGTGPTFIVDGLIDTEATLVYGADKAGKSTLLHSLALALVRGDEHWCNLSITPRVGGYRVAFLVTDAGGRAEVARRLAALDAQAASEVLVARLDVSNGHQSWSLNTDELVKARVNVVVVDHAIGSLPDGADASQQHHAEMTLRPLRRMADDAGIAVVLVHHTSKPMPAAKGQAGSSGKSPLGSRAWGAYGRTKVLVTKPQGGTAERRTLEVEGTNTETITHEMAVNFEDNAPVWRRWEGKAPVAPKPRERDPERLENVARMRAWVVQHCQGMSRKQVGDALAVEFVGASPSTRNREMGPDDIIGKGLLREGRGAATTWSHRPAAD